MTPGDPLLNARALVLADLAAQGLVDPHTVSLSRTAWRSAAGGCRSGQQGASFIDGLVAQDVQDALFDEARRWPLCVGCADPVEHSLSIEPELGPDPHWVCSESGYVVAPLGRLPRSSRSSD